MKAASTSLVPAPAFLRFTLVVRAIRRFMHAPITTSAPPDIRTANHLIIVHANRGHLHLAHQWFAQMPHKNIFSWTILISAYSRHGELAQCFGLFSQMLSHHRPNDFAYSSLLSVCDYWHGVQVHGLAFRTGFDAWIYVANALIAMYWNNSCNADVEAWRVFEAMDFRNLITYNSMITGLSMDKQGDKAMDLFIGMRRNGIEFDHTTLLTLVSSLCGSSEGSNKIVGFMCCLQLHSFGIKTGLALDIGVVTALIRGYSILGGEVDACHKLFLETSSMDRDVVLWTEIMMASAEREPEQTLVLFKRMLGEDLFPDCYIFSVVLKACSNLVVERNASALHCQVIKAGFLNVLELGNALIHAYARSGSINNAEQVFFEMSLRDIVSWNSVLKAYAVHGKAEAALDFFKQMDVAPDGTTFVALLSSCSHAGMVKEGTKIFDTMYEKYGITPQLDHYACMLIF
ncbi:UNVERIFIED_CONTAM: Pentatricopeptide repeat-containing protein [Sesamum radiatum]|uniref:Pentatricopeptide repeat-containing protein n=1 Tax=Sesamum radiatum TaxID=300843 RepID=A0AAW2NQM3_SESRA